MSAWLTCFATVFGAGQTVAGPSPADVAGIAHRTLPIGILVEVEWRGKRVTLPVVDRGPWGKTDSAGNWFNACPRCPDRDRPGRWRGCVDLTSKAAREIGFSGRARVRVRRAR